MCVHNRNTPGYERKRERVVAARTNVTKEKKGNRE